MCCIVRFSETKLEFCNTFIMFKIFDHSICLTFLEFLRRYTQVRLVDSNPHPRYHLICEFVKFLQF